MVDWSNLKSKTDYSLISCMLVKLVLNILVINHTLLPVIPNLTLIIIFTGSRKNSKPTEAFQIGFPMRTNYMYGRLKHTLLHEIFSFTLCLWMKAGIGPGLGTPFSYSVPGQANELVLIEWGNNPMELLVDDRVSERDEGMCTDLIIWNQKYRGLLRILFLHANYSLKVWGW